MHIRFGNRWGRDAQSMCGLYAHPPRCPFSHPPTHPCPSLWLRARRPSIERVVYGMYDTFWNAYDTVFGSFIRAVDYQCPGFGFKCVALLGFLLGYNVMT